MQRGSRSGEIRRHAGSRAFRVMTSGCSGPPVRLSLIGDGAFLIALGWKTTTLTGSATSLAIVLMAQSLALLTTLLIGGALADRYSRRMLMIASDLSRFVIIGALAIIDAGGLLSFPLLLAIAVAFGLADGFFYPAAGGIVPTRRRITSARLREHADRRLAARGVRRRPALAGTIYGLAGSSVVFGFDAATFALSARLLVATRPRTFEPEVSDGTFQAIGEASATSPAFPGSGVGIAVTSFVLMVAMAPFQALAPTFVAEQFDAGVGAYGLLFAFEALGMTIGMIAFGQINPRRRRIWQIFGFLALNDLFAVLMTLQDSYDAAAAIMVVRGSLIGYAIGVWSTLLMEWVPEGKLARVTSLDFFGAIGLVPLGYALTALVSQTVRAGDDPHLRFRAGGARVGLAAARSPRSGRGVVQQSGCPDLNWGPLRPERSALPGCATPRAPNRLPTLSSQPMKLYEPRVVLSSALRHPRSPGERCW